VFPANDCASGIRQFAKQNGATAYGGYPLLRG
jgi:hypothetical protein